MQPLFVLLMYPAVIFIVLQPASFRWVYKHRTEKLSLEFTRKALQAEFEKGGRWLLLGKLFLSAVLLCVWVKWTGFAPALLTTLSGSIPASIGTGLLAGALLVCGKFLFRDLIRRVPFVRPDPSQHPQTRGSILVWVLILVLGAAFEEPWRALCLIAFREAGWSLVLGVILTSGAFVFAHVTGFPGRIPTINYEDSWEFLVGVFLAVLFLKYGNIVVPYVTSVVFSIANFVLLRRAMNGWRAH